MSLLPPKFQLESFPLQLGEKITKNLTVNTITVTNPIKSQTNISHIKPGDLLLCEQDYPDPDENILGIFILDEGINGKFCDACKYTVTSNFDKSSEPFFLDRVIIHDHQSILVDSSGPVRFNLYKRGISFEEANEVFENIRKNKKKESDESKLAKLTHVHK